MSDGTVVGGDIHGARGDGYGIREIDLLPPRSGFVGKSRRGKKRSGATAKVPDVRSRVCGTFIEANAGNVPIDIRLERNS